MGPADLTPGQSRRFVALLTTLVVAIAFAGFVVGVSRGPGSARATSRAPEPAEIPRELIAAAHGVVPALRYDELPTRRRGPNARFGADLAAMAIGVSATTLEADDGDAGAASGEAAADADVHAALDARAARRAYDGAPPVVPHPIVQRSTAACLSCHRDGLRAGSVRAPAMSHRPMANCTQCHVEGRASTLPLAPAAAVPNGFVGLASPTAGARAFAGAPPTMPHRTAMRERCGSCHGPSGQPGLRTSHFGRASCLQCHAPGADLDQRDDGAGGPPLSSLGDRWPLPPATRGDVRGTR